MRKSESSDVAHDNVDTDTPRNTAQRVVNELVRVLYFCQSDMQQYRLNSVVKMAAKPIDIINQNSTEIILKMLLNLGYLA
jgi:hypothetical protein